MKAITSRGSYAALLSALVLGCALGACAAASKSPQTAAPAAMEPLGERASDPRTEIDRLWDEIAMWQGQGSATGEDASDPVSMSSGAEGAGGSEGAGGAGGTGTMRGSERGAERAAGLCPDQGEGAAPLCSDVCVLAGSICDNADSICRIAGDLAGDTWAEGRCQKARTACERATERCCACRRGERPAGD
jgi:hypothetical protein